MTAIEVIKMDLLDEFEELGVEHKIKVLGEFIGIISDCGCSQELASQLQTAFLEVRCQLLK